MIYESGIIQKVAARIAPPEYSADLAQEIILIIASKNPDEMERIFRNNEMNFYASRIAKNIFDTKNSFFVKLYRPHEYNEDLSAAVNAVDETYDDSVDEIFNLAIREMNAWPTSNGFPYEKKMFLLFVEIGNKKQIERLTGIPYRSICAVIDNRQKRLKYAVFAYYRDNDCGR